MTQVMYPERVQVLYLPIVGERYVRAYVILQVFADAAQIPH